MVLTGSIGKSVYYLWDSYFSVFISAIGKCVPASWVKWTCGQTGTS